MLSNLLGAATVLRPARLPKVERGGGARTTPLVTAARGATGFINGITEFDPAASIAEHTHNVAESVMIIRGRANVRIDGAHYELDASDTTFIPANVAHRFSNASTTEPMSLFWTYGSIDSTRTVTATGSTHRIDAEHVGVPASPPLVRLVVDYEVRANAADDFEAAVAQNALGARSFRLERSETCRSQYRLTIAWESLDDHRVRFLDSAAQRAWHQLVERHLVHEPSIGYVRTVLDGFWQPERFGCSPLPRSGSCHTPRLCSTKREDSS